MADLSIHVRSIDPDIPPDLFLFLAAFLSLLPFPLWRSR